MTVEIEAHDQDHGQDTTDDSRVEVIYMISPTHVKLG